MVFSSEEIEKLLEETDPDDQHMPASARWVLLFFLICRMFEKLEKITVRRKILIRKCALCI